jgi:uncharacterized membrane protein YciS (DUF1049 family)
LHACQPLKLHDAARRTLSRVRAAGDLVYMLMQALSHLFKNVIRGSGRPFAALNLASSLVGVALDAATGAAVLTNRVAAMRALVALHVVLFAVTCAVSWLVIAIFRLLIVIVVERVRPRLCRVVLALRTRALSRIEPITLHWRVMGCAQHQHWHGLVST